MIDGNQEIIIVRRNYDSEDSHHGGAWKIAFADFMTAMMALFLVLWLVNAANEETKKAVASYFNPVKLVDRNKSSRGLSDPGGPSNMGNEGTRDEPYSEEMQIETPAETPNVEINDAVFFADPDVVIETILAAAAAEKKVAETATENATAAEVTFIDPFAPESWQATDPQAGNNLFPGEKNILEHVASPSPQAYGEPNPKPLDAPSDTPGSQPAEGDTVEVESSNQGPDTTIAPITAIEQNDQSAAIDTAKAAAVDEEQFRSKGAIIAESVAVALTAAGLAQESVAIEERNEVVVVSLMDGDQFEMFGVGSAVPNAEAIFALEALAAPIIRAGGKIRIVGHTDGRQFQSGKNDNWKLSSDRGLAAFYVLHRAGVGEDRISSLSGKADSELRIETDPLDARNRRIEVLLEVKP